MVTERCPLSTQTFTPARVALHARQVLDVGGVGEDPGDLASAAVGVTDAGSTGATAVLASAGGAPTTGAAAAATIDPTARRTVVPLSDELINEPIDARRGRAPWVTLHGPHRSPPRGWPGHVAGTGLVPRGSSSINAAAAR